MCKELAESGFNICVVARNKEKIEGRLKEIWKVNKKIRTMSVVADFEKMETMEDYRK
jgi:short-subunit dehydrogenase